MLNKNVKLTDLPRLNSRTLVRDTMLMAGVAVGQFCIKNNISVSFSTQPEHDLGQDGLENIDSIADMFATRKNSKEADILHNLVCMQGWD